MQITVTCELTARNLEILKQLCKSEPENDVYTIHDALVEHHKEVLAAEHPVENPFPETPKAEEKPKVEEKPKLTAADVKAVCLKYSKAGRQSELKAAFAKFGAKKLTEISEDDYPALMEELGNE